MHSLHCEETSRTKWSTGTFRYSSALPCRVISQWNDLCHTHVLFALMEASVNFKTGIAMYAVLPHCYFSGLCWNRCCFSWNSVWFCMILVALSGVCVCVCNTMCTWPSEGRGQYRRSSQLWHSLAKSDCGWVGLFFITRMAEVAAVTMGLQHTPQKMWSVTSSQKYEPSNKFAGDYIFLLLLTIL